MTLGPSPCVIVLAAIVGFEAGASSARGVVVGPSGSPAPSGYIASWNGASAVPVGDQWLLSARHVGGDAGGTVTLGDETFTATRIVLNPREDLQLIRVDRPLPGWHALAHEGAAAEGRNVILGGVGYRAGGELGDGFDWSGGPGAAWGANAIDQVGARLLLTFDAPGAAGAVAGESIFTWGDSGGGVFVPGGADGSLRLVGIATSLSSQFGASRYGDVALAVNLEPWMAWITSHVAPGVPVASSIAAPMPGTFIPAPVPAPGVAGVFVGLGAAAACRRSRR